MSPASDDFPTLLDQLLDRQSLDQPAAHAIMDRTLTGELGPERLAAVVTALRAKTPTGAELAGFAQAMRERSNRIDPGLAAGAVVIDNCGTGGAPIKTVNISTMAAFVMAADGLTVAKHGNRSVTRPSGSADILEAAGARLDLTPSQVQQVLRKVGIAFLFAPAFHPGMKHAAPVRKALGIKTIFNLLGPLTNPAGATHQVLGVYHPELMEPMADALARLGCKAAYVVHTTRKGQPGFDEATACGTIHLAPIRDGAVARHERLDPSELGLAPVDPAALAPVAAVEAPALMNAVLSGKAPAPIADAVALNAALGLHAAGRATDLPAALERAQGILAEGSGLGRLEAFVAATKAA